LDKSDQVRQSRPATVKTTISQIFSLAAGQEKFMWIASGNSREDVVTSIETPAGHRSMKIQLPSLDSSRQPFDPAEQGLTLTEILIAMAIS